MPASDPQQYRIALRAAVYAALAGYGSGAAKVDEGWNAEHEVWGIDITPTAGGAAPAYLAYSGGDEVSFGFGCTSLYLWHDDPEMLADKVRVLLEAVFAGRFVEAGGEGRGFAKVAVAGESWRVGAMQLPLPWRFSPNAYVPAVLSRRAPGSA